MTDTEKAKDRHQETLIPFSWTGWDDCGDTTLLFYDVIMTGDFGPIKSGQKFAYAQVDFQKGIFEVFETSGVEIPTHQVMFKAQPI